MSALNCMFIISQLLFLTIIKTDEKPFKKYIIQIKDLIFFKIENKYIHLYLCKLSIKYTIDI